MILLLNLLQNVLYLSVAIMNVIFRKRTGVLGAPADYETQIMNAAWCLLGLPFIVCGIWGMVAKLEQNMRLYLYYISFSLFLEVACAIITFASTDFCATVPPFLAKH